MLYSLFNYRKAPPLLKKDYGTDKYSFQRGGIFLRALVETFGKEIRGGLWSTLSPSGKEILDHVTWVDDEQDDPSEQELDHGALEMGERAHSYKKISYKKIRRSQDYLIAMGYYTNDNVDDKSPDETIFAWWKCINPVKWLEFIACLLYHSIDELTLLPLPDPTGEAEPSLEGKISLWPLDENSKRSFSFRSLLTLVLRIVSVAAEWAFHVVRWITSPLNHVYRPLALSCGKYWNNHSGKTKLCHLVIALVVIGVVLALIASLPIGGGLFPVFAAIASGIVSTVSSVASGLSVAATAATLGLVAIPATHLGFTVAAGYVLLISAVASLQRFLTEFIPAFKNIYYGLSGMGGYSKQAHMINSATAEPCKCVPRHPGDRPLEAVELDSSHAQVTQVNSKYGQYSTAEAFCLFGRKLIVKDPEQKYFQVKKSPVDNGILLQTYNNSSGTEELTSLEMGSDRYGTSYGAGLVK